MITSQNNRFSMGGRYRSFLIAAGAMLAAATALATTIDPSNYRCAMSISPAAGKVTSTISENFPLLVRLSSTRQLGFDPAECGVNGADLRFALADGTLLAHEIDTWNQTGESLVWVNVPSLAADTKVIAYWGVRDSSLAPAVNPADTWPDFIGVWHLGEGNATVHDSSGNGYDAVNIAAVSAGKDPKVGGCVSCSNLFVTEVFDFTSSTAVKPLIDRSKLTITSWATIDDFDRSSEDNYGNAKNARVDIANKLSGWGDGNGGFSLRFFEDNGYAAIPAPFYGITINSGTGGSSIDNWNTKTSSTGGKWRYFTYTMDDKAAVKYENATVVESSTRGHGILGPDVTVPLKFGASDTHSGKANTGLVVVRMDELRIRNGAASAAWVAADYAQQNSDTFLEYGAVTSVFSVSPIADQFTTSAAELEAGLQPAVTVSNLIDGVELVAGTHYTVTYSDNHSYGVATATVTGIGNYDGKIVSAPFVIHSTKQVDENYSLTDDEDWLAFETVGIGTSTIDLKGHKLTISGLDGSGTITDSVGGGELWIDVCAGRQITISSVALTGKLTLVKTGPGMLSAAKAGQTFTGGTRIVSGVVKYACSSDGRIDVTHPFGFTSATAMGPITIEEGGILDPGGSQSWGNHTLIINGGMISNTVAGGNITYGIFNPKTTVNGDFTFATLENYAWTVPDLSGHTVTVDIGVGKIFNVATSVIYPIITGGRMNVVRGGNLATFSNKTTDLHMVDLDCFNAALNLSGPMSVRDYGPQYTGNYGKGNVALDVYGTFTPASNYFYGPTMRDGSAIDLSAKTDAWSVTSSLTDGGNATTKFAAGATVTVILGERKCKVGDKVISWATAPDSTVSFTSKKATFESRSDGLYITEWKGSGLSIFVR